MNAAGLRAAIAALAAAVSWQAIAQPAQSSRVRGTIERLDGDVLSVKQGDGAPVRIRLTGDAKIVGVAKASFADIKPGSFVGSAATPQPDGSQKALEVHIFPEAMRGTGEGHRPYILPNSTMTNGTVGDVVTGVSGDVLTVKYKGGEKRIVVPADVPIVRYEIGDRSHLKPGAAVTILRATRKPDGTYESDRVNVGLGGVSPR